MDLDILPHIGHTDSVPFDNYKTGAPRTGPGENDLCWFHKQMFYTIE